MQAIFGSGLPLQYLTQYEDNIHDTRTIQPDSWSQELTMNIGISESQFVHDEMSSVLPWQEAKIDLVSLAMARTLVPSTRSCDPYSPIRLSSSSRLRRVFLVFGPDFHGLAQVSQVLPKSIFRPKNVGVSFPEFSAPAPTRQNANHPESLRTTRPFAHPLSLLPHRKHNRPTRNGSSLQPTNQISCCDHGHFDSATVSCPSGENAAHRETPNHNVAPLRYGQILKHCPAKRPGGLFVPLLPSFVENAKANNYADVSLANREEPM